MALGGFVLGSLILYLNGTRTTMSQLSGFYYKSPGPLSAQPHATLEAPTLSAASAAGPCQDSAFAVSENYGVVWGSFRGYFIRVL